MTPGDEIAAEIASRGIPLYGPQLDPTDQLYYANSLLQQRLNAVLAGRSYGGLPLRTRSKAAKTDVCVALGYSPPRSFAKTSPRFPSQNFDVHVQQANNLQIWNQDVEPTRRYVVVGLDGESTVRAVRVISGQELALLDRTRALTTKYQASLTGDPSASRLVSSSDTDSFRTALGPIDVVRPEWSLLSPTAEPSHGDVLSVAAVYRFLQPLVGLTFHDPGATQDRLRSVELQRAVCSALGLGGYADGGQFPDVPAQAVEVKLQLSRTIDLGLVCPDDRAVAPELGSAVRHCDVRYAVFFATRLAADRIELASLVVSTGQDFFTAFRRFEGKVVNQKRQIRLPTDFYAERS